MDLENEELTGTGRDGRARDLACLDDKIGLWLRVAQKRWVEQVNRRFSRHRTNHMEFLILTLVDRNPDCRLMLVAEQLRLQPPNAAKAVEDLVSRGMLSKAADPTDRRAVRLKLAERGEQLLKVLNLEHESLRQDVLRGVEPGAVDQLVTTLRRIIIANRGSAMGGGRGQQSWS
jgi:DNA-binding MarR family transcriptional regulator